MVKLTVKPIKGDEFKIDAEWTQTVSLAVKTDKMSVAYTSLLCCRYDMCAHDGPLLSCRSALLIRLSHAVDTF